MSEEHSISSESESETEVVNENAFNKSEPKESKPKLRKDGKPKRVMTPEQLEKLKYARERAREAIAKKKKATMTPKQILKEKKIIQRLEKEKEIKELKENKDKLLQETGYKLTKPDTPIEQPLEKAEPQINKEEQKEKEKSPTESPKEKGGVEGNLGSLDESESESEIIKDLEEQLLLLKKSEPKKKKKKKIVVVESESESESEEEVVVVRKKKRRPLGKVEPQIRKENSIKSRPAPPDLDQEEKNRQIRLLFPDF